MPTIPLADRLAIHDLIHAYAFYSDTKQYHKIADLFCDDASFDESCLGLPTVHGKNNLKVTFDVPSTKYAYFVHYISNILFHDFHETSAHVTSYLRGEGVLTNGAQPLVLGYYDDRLRREQGAWRIASRTLVAFAPPSGFQFAANARPS